MRTGLIIGIIALTTLLFFSAAQSVATTNGPSVLAQLDTLTDQLAKDRAQFEDAQADLNATITAQQTELDTLARARDDLAAKLADADATTAQAADLEAENAALSEAAMTAQAALAQSQAAYADIEAQLNEWNSDRALVTSLKAENAALKDTLAAQPTQTSDDAQIAALQSQINEKTEALALADTRIAELSQSIEQQAQIKADLDDTKTQLSAAFADIAAQSIEISELEAQTATPVVSAASVCQENLDALVAGSTIGFAQGSTDISADAKPLLDQIATMAVPCSKIDLRLEIEGHTDSAGGDASNLLLSNGRANAVYSYLKNKGVPETAMRAVGFGASDPIADNDTAQGRQLNRRIAFKWNAI